MPGWKSIENPSIDSKGNVVYLEATRESVNGELPTSPVFAKAGLELAKQRRQYASESTSGQAISAKEGYSAENTNGRVQNSRNRATTANRTIARSRRISRFSRPLTQVSGIITRVQKHEPLIKRRVDELDIADKGAVKTTATAPSINAGPSQITEPGVSEPNMSRIERLRALAAEYQGPASRFVYRDNGQGTKSARQSRTNGTAASHYPSGGPENGKARNVINRKPSGNRSPGNDFHKTNVLNTTGKFQTNITPAHATHAQRVIGVPRLNAVTEDNETVEPSARISGEELDYVASKVYLYVKQKMITERERHGRPGWALWP